MDMPRSKERHLMCPDASHCVCMLLTRARGCACAGSRHLDASLNDILGAVGRTNQAQMRVQPATGDVYRHASVDSPGVSLSGSQHASLPLRKRPRDDEPPQVPKVASQASNSNSKMSVADYLKQKTSAGSGR